MKTLKLRTKEDVSESALLQDMQLFLSASLKVSDELERQDLPLYKQIKADVEEKPLTVGTWLCGISQRGQTPTSRDS